MPSCQKRSTRERSLEAVPLNTALNMELKTPANMAAERAHTTRGFNATQIRQYNARAARNC